MTDALGESFANIGSGIGNLAQGGADALGSVGNSLGSMFGAGGTGGLPGDTSTAGSPFSAAASGLAQGTPATPTAGISPAAFAGSLPNGSMDGGSGAAPASSGLGNISTTPDTVTPGASGPLGSVTMGNVPGLNTSPPPGISAGGGAHGGWQQLLQPKNAIPAGVLGYALYNGLHQSPEEKQLKALAGDQAANAKFSGNLEQTAINGQLPGPAMAALAQAKAAARAQVRGKYANAGLSGSTAEANDLSQVEQSFVAQQFQIGQGMAQTGLSELQSASGAEQQLYEYLLKSGTEQGTALGDLLAKFAAAATH